MEKFTVDLDKVLDEFEFNEEQAVRHALQHFKREDLPATRYQKPHFKPINIADADFSPSLETTMKDPTCLPNPSDFPTESLSRTPAPLSSFEPSEVNQVTSNWDSQVAFKENITNHVDKDEGDKSSITKTDEIQSGNKAENRDSVKVFVEESVGETKKPLESSEEEEDETAAGEATKEMKLPENYEINAGVDISEDAIVEENKSSVEFKSDEDSEAELQPEIESQKEIETEVAEVKIVQLSSLVSEKETIVENSKEPLAEPAEKPVKEPVKEPVIEPVIEKTEIKPIQFETQIDITDEELTKFLEELEEEDEKNREKEKESENQSKPPRPDKLELNKNTGEDPQTDEISGIDVDAGTRSEETYLRNGYKEEKRKEDAEESDECNGILDDSRESETGLTVVERRLGKVSPFWMPDHLASSCMECDSKFTVIKRRHHCRACGRILCSKCCGMRASLEYLQNQEQRVCETCFCTLAKVMMYELQGESEGESLPRRRPNPNNPMEYCSTVPPPLQVSGTVQSPPSVLVPVGVLKREGSSRVKETPKQVMFSDGIRPGGDLTELDGSGDHRNTFRKPGRMVKRAGTPPGTGTSAMLPPTDSVSQSFIVEKSLPPICIVNKGETTYEENWPPSKIMENLKDPNTPPLVFAINRNLVASVKIVKLDCCMKELCWVIVSKGMACVGQDEIVVLLTLVGEDDEKFPKEILLQFHYIYQEAGRGNTVNELGCWCVKESTFLDSKQHGGFLFIRPSFQCLKRIETPSPPFLVGVLIHRSEILWARVFPLRLMLRLGAEFKYYPCPLVSVRFREPVYYEIGHTIIKILADLRNLSYTIPSVRGLRIHMEDNQTSILIPRNRYDEVVRALKNSSDPVLALAGNFSPEADAHLVCKQSEGNEITYSSQAININDKPRKVTGASFVVLNGALKTTSGVAAKSSIIEDGLMVQVPSDTMVTLRNKLENMEDWSVACGPIEGRNAEEQVVKIIWSEDDKNFNVGVKSVIDNLALDGVPSIRVLSSKGHVGGSKFIRWTEVFIIKCEDGATSAKIGDPLEVNKLSETIARSTCIALTKLLDLLAASGLTVLAVRATIDQDNVGYEAGSNGEKLAPIYMNSLDNELIPVLHNAASINDSVAVLELIFHIMNL